MRKRKLLKSLLSRLRIGWNIGIESHDWTIPEFIYLWLFHLDAITLEQPCAHCPCTNPWPAKSLGSQDTKASIEQGRPFPGARGRWLRLHSWCRCGLDLSNQYSYSTKMSNLHHFSKWSHAQIELMSIWKRNILSIGGRPPSARTCRTLESKCK